MPATAPGIWKTWSARSAPRRSGSAIPRSRAREALAMGLINQVVPDAELKSSHAQFALEIADRGAFALASVKAAFNARHGGVCGPVAHGARPAAARLSRDRREQGAVRGLREPSASPIRRSSGTERQVSDAPVPDTASSRHGPRATTSRACGRRTRFYGLLARHAAERPGCARAAGRTAQSDLARAARPGWTVSRPICARTGLRAATASRSGCRTGSRRS